MTINKFSASTLPHGVAKIAIAVDLVILTTHENTLCALLIRRGIEPYAGQWALPGGFVKADEGLETAAWRELEEETGVSAHEVGHLEQLGTFGDVARDPRGRVLSVTYLALVRDLPHPNAGGDAAHAALVPVSAALQAQTTLAFDHRTLLNAGIERARAKLEYTPLATSFCEDEFTIQQLRRVYETVWGRAIDPSNFHRKVTKADGFIEATNHVITGESGRPAQLYRRGNAKALYPPLLRGTAE